MHRVYNSAFMVMLRDEDNAKYRLVLKNTLEFDPDIMKRYVNFMSNPDERTAIDQFGKGDKCFGVAVMMSTLPGLPMFGHGQIEGFTEKYGMEYRWPRYQEDPDRALVERHEREIAPLLKRRWLFAESANFLLYDFYLDNGSVDENIFAYSNRNGSERALVVYNNRYGDAHGTIDFSAAYADKGSGQLRQRRVGEGLGLSGDRGTILAYRDSLTGLEYLRRASEVNERGFRVNLHAYQSHVFLDWRELRATARQPWDRLCDHLHGHGVPNLDNALVDLELQPVHDALRRLLDPDAVRLFADLAEHPRTAAIAVSERKSERERTGFFEQVWTRAEGFLRAAQTAYAARLGQEDRPARTAVLTSNEQLADDFRKRLRAAMRIPAVEALFPSPWTAAARRMLPSPSPQFTATAMWGPILGWCVLELLAESIDAQNPERAALDLFDRLRLRDPFARAFTVLGFESEESWRVAARIKVVLLTGAGVGTEQGTDAPEPPSSGLTPSLWRDPDVRWLTGVHEAEGREYIIRERYEELLWWMRMPELLRVAGEAVPRRTAVEELSRAVNEALAAAEDAGYRVDVLIGEAHPADEDGADIRHDGEPTPGVDYLMPPLERDEHDEPLPGRESHENLYGAERTPGVDFEMPPLERDEHDERRSSHDPHAESESHENMYGGERSPGIDFEMPPLERDEHDEPARGQDLHEDMYGGERSTVDFEMPPLERDERDAPASEPGSHADE
jgi:hypothetical protein